MDTNLNVVDGAVRDGHDGSGPFLGLDDRAEAVHVADVAAVDVHNRTVTLKMAKKGYQPRLEPTS